MDGKHCALLLLSVAVIVQGKCIKKEECKDNWAQFGSNCYKVFPDQEAVLYAGARDLCIGEGGDMASISSKEENNFVAELALTMDLSQPLIGLYWNDTFAWTDGSPVSFESNHQSETLEEGELYVFRLMTDRDDQFGSWADVLYNRIIDNSVPLPYVCKRPVNVDSKQ